MGRRKRKKRRGASSAEESAPQAAEPAKQAAPAAASKESPAPEPADGPSALPALLLCAALGLLYAVYAYLSEGAFNDDDIARFFNTRGALGRPREFIDLWNRPGFVLVYVLPAQLGYWAVELTTVAITTLTAWFSYTAARAFGLRPAWLAAGLAGLMPFVLLLSFSALTEPLAACLLAAALTAWARGRLTLSAGLVALLPLARTELALLLGVWGLALLLRRHWRGLFLLPLGLFLWNAAGWYFTGRPLWLLGAIFPENAPRLYDAVELWHYPKGFIFIVGPVVFGLLLVGLVVECWRMFVELSTSWQRFLLIAGSFCLVSAAYIYLSAYSTTGQAAGFLRHFVSLAPLMALLALRGFEVWLRPKGRHGVVALGVLALACWLCYRYLSVELVGSHFLGQEVEHAKLALVGGLTVILLARMLVPTLARGRQAVTWLALLVLAGHASYATSHVDPIPLTEEQEMIRELADWYAASGLADRPTLCNQVWFHLFTGRDWLDKEETPFLKNASMAAAEPGTIAIWESHYGHRLHGDVSLDDLNEARAWRTLRAFSSPDGRRLAAVYEKLPEPGRRGAMPRGDYVHEAFGVRFGMMRAPAGWQYTPVEQGLTLLKGVRSDGSGQLELRIERHLNPLLSVEAYLGGLSQQLAANPAVTVGTTGRTEDGRWALLRYSTSSAWYEQWVTLSPARAEALVVTFVVPSGGIDPSATFPALIEQIDAEAFRAEPGTP